MVEYKKFKIADMATLRVRSENIVATVSSKDQNKIDLYVAGLTNPFHIKVSDSESARDMMDYVWERNDKNIDMED